METDTAVPATDIAGVARAQAALAATLANLSDEQVRRPSLLPGWSVGHVLTHVARNADSGVDRPGGDRARSSVPP